MSAISGIFKAGVRASSDIEKTLHNSKGITETFKDADHAREAGKAGTETGRRMTRKELHNGGGAGPKGPDNPSFIRQYGSAAGGALKGQAIKHPLAAGATVAGAGIYGKHKFNQFWNGTGNNNGNQPTPTAYQNGQGQTAGDKLKNGLGLGKDAGLLGAGALGALFLGGNGKFLKTGLVIAALAMIAKNFNAISNGISQLGDKGQAMSDNTPKLTTGADGRTPNQKVNQAADNQRNADNQTSQLNPNNSAAKQQYLAQTKQNIQTTVDKQPEYQQQLQGPSNSNAKSLQTNGPEVSM